MKVIISKDIQDIFNNFVVVDSFQKVRDLKGVTTIIVHTYKDEDFSAGVLISEFHKKGVVNFLYLNPNPSLTIKMCIEGVKGIYLEDDFYLEDEEELLSLLEDYDLEQDETSLSQPNIKIVNDFIQSFARGEAKIQAPVYLEQVTQAVNSLSEITKNQEAQITAMGTSALEVFEKASDIIRTLNDNRAKIEQQLKELEDAKDDKPTGRASFSNSINTFRMYKHLGVTKVLLIKEYTPCRYLTSFCLAYLHHLHYIKNKRVKLIFIHLKGAYISTLYKDFTSITVESASMTSLYDAEVIATNNPKKDVMKELLSRGDDIAIVVDRMYSTEDMVTGRGVTRLNAVSGKNDISKFKLIASETITSTVSCDNSFVTIPTVKDFPTEKDMRYSVYNQIMSDTFNKIDTKIGIK